MHNLNGAPRIIRVRWHAEQPPAPLGCRWCGHPPYAHDAATLPHRPGHLWDQPTSAQVHARMAARRRLGLCGPPLPNTPRSMPHTTPSNTPRTAPDTVTARPLRVHHPAPPPAGRHRHPRPAVATAVPYGRESPPGARPPYGRREPYRVGATV
ncbi:hypothetical protein FHR32_002164 [Streptosporangium album]|uniref:Uncharacterized protein n=1 Tax=Streptosporangium album TaxID=47479 RepID=A0A7W7W9A3_9ACTN|nr:hypothetical protein [Streptosporangium album]MBB4937859.1 hypothetical protein [Streptosporangium album]